MDYFKKFKLKKLILANTLILLLASCGKQCLECKYSTLKGTVVEKSCSSVKADRDAFQLEMETDAEANGTVAICTKETY